jgi:hypothetical protein
MIFDRTDEAFVLQATDATLRSKFLWGLRVGRAVSFIAGSFWAVWWFFHRYSDNAGVFAAMAILFCLISAQTDSHVKVLKLFERASSINPVQPTRASARG